MRNAVTINPTTLREALKAKAQRGVVAIAGGTDVLVGLHDVIDRPWPRLLVLTGVRGLHNVKEKGGSIVLGPLVTFSEIEKSPFLKKHTPQLAHAASLASCVQIRNRATIGGNLAHASPSGDLIPPLFILSAKVELSSARTKRMVHIEDFFTGPGATVLRPGELITSVVLEKSGTHGFYLRLAARKALAISKVSVAADLVIRKKKVERVRIALGAVAPTVVRAHRTEEYLSGKELSATSIAAASSIAEDEARPIDDIRSQADYRRAMVGILLARGLSEVSGSLRKGRWR